jgi:acyl carrier protein
MSKPQIEQAVKEYVLSEFLPDESPDALDASTPLISGGILDSIATLKLVAHLEDTHGIEFEAHEVSADHLDTLSAIADIVESKVAKK